MSEILDSVGIAMIFTIQLEWDHSETIVRPVGSCLKYSPWSPVCLWDLSFDEIALMCWFQRRSARASPPLVAKRSQDVCDPRNCGGWWTYAVIALLIGELKKAVLTSISWIINRRQAERAKKHWDRAIADQWSKSLGVIFTSNLTMILINKTKPLTYSGRPLLLRKFTPCWRKSRRTKSM